MNTKNGVKNSTYDASLDTVNDAPRSEAGSKEQVHTSLVSDGKPAPGIVRVFGLQPVWPLAPGTWVSVRGSMITHRSEVFHTRY